MKVLPLAQINNKIKMKTLFKKYNVDLNGFQI